MGLSQRTTAGRSPDPSRRPTARQEGTVFTSWGTPFSTLVSHPAGGWPSGCSTCAGDNEEEALLQARRLVAYARSDGDHPPVTPGMHLGPRTRHHPQAAPGHPPGRQEGPLRSRCEWPPSSSEPITLREPVPLVPCLAPLRLSPTIPRSFSGKLVGQFRKTAVALRYAMTVPVPSPCSLTRLSSRPVSVSLYRPFYRQCSCRSASAVTLCVNLAIHRPPPCRRRSRDRPVSCHGRSPGAPAPC